MEVPILYYNYRCHIRHYDDPNLRKIIQLHIQVCEEIGNRECLPVEGDLITLAFECKGEEQFFYDWLNEGAMHNGEIHFIYNEVEIVDIFRFWDCFCVKIEEYMSVGNSPMMMVLYSQQPFISIAPESKEEKQAEIVEVYWMDAEGTRRIEELPESGIATLCAKVKNANAGETVKFEIEYDDGSIIKLLGKVNLQGEVKIENVKLNQKQESK